MKKILYALLIVLLSCTCANAADKTEYCAADELYVMGLFNGVGTDQYSNPIYDLDAKPTREQAVALLVRLLGKEQEAMSHTWDTSFTDLSQWAAPYIGYAYTNGLTKGVSETKFGSSAIVSDIQYYTFLLRALGYQDGKDFTWDKAQALTDKLGITNNKYDNFTRGKVCVVSVNALDTKVKGEYCTLLSTIDSITEEQLWHRKYAQIAAQNSVEAERFCYDAKLKSVSRYDIPTELGKQTLTFDEAEALVGRAPIIVKNRVQTFADVLQYSIAASFGSNNDVFTPCYGSGGVLWGYDWDGEVQLANNWFTCCGGASNYIGYLLDGDYDDEGWIQYWGGGNHHFNWVKENGKYYILDLTLYANGGYYNTTEQKVVVANSLEEFFNNQWPADYASKSEIQQAYYCVNSSGGVPRISSSGKLIYASEAQGKLHMLYVAPGYKSDFSFETPSIKIPGYNYYSDVKEANYNEIKSKIEAAEKGKLGSPIKIKFVSGNKWNGRIFDRDNIGFAGHNITLAVLYYSEEITDYEFTCDHQNEAPVVKQNDGRLFLRINDTALDNTITIKYRGEAFTFRWVGAKNVN